MTRTRGAAPPTITVGDVEKAAARLRGVVRATPLLSAGELSRRFEAPVALKAENLQLTGSFKVRGAHNRIADLDARERAAGVVAGSAGNHAQGVAYAGRRLGTPVTVYMPAAAPLAKVAAVRAYGGEVRLVEGGYEEARAAAASAAEREGRTVVPAFDHPLVVAGQGTVGLEIAEQAPATRLCVVPLGGGGLAGGIALALKERLPGVRVVGVRPAAVLAGAAAPIEVPPTAPPTICDGIAVKRPGQVTGPLLDRYLDDVVTVTDDEAAAAIVLLLERSKLVAEGAGAVGVAALMAGQIEPPAGGETCVVVSGGNVDAALLAECIRMGETASGRRIVITAQLADRPGALARLLAVVAAHGGNVVEIEHLRDGLTRHVRETAVHLTLATGGPAADEAIMAALGEEGIEAGLVR